MGMTIDETISVLKALKECTFSYMRDYHAFVTAIKIMYKYQKIVDIVTDDYGYPSNLRKIMDIREVIDDGNDNC